MKIGIVGTGHVGSTAAYSLVLQGIGNELVLVDHNRDLADAHAMDILHATPFSHPAVIRSGNFSDLTACALVILSAGVAQMSGEGRMALLERNAAVFADIVPQIVKHAPDAVLLVATNPLDVMTQIAISVSGLPPGRVFGTGTVLDSARFRALLGQQYGVAPNSIHAYVVGEHGDSEVLLWSSAMAAGIPLADFALACGQSLTQEVQERIDHEVRSAAYRIISGKGATYYGIGAAIASLSRCILYDERKVFTTCSSGAVIDDVESVALSLPRVIGSGGILSTLKPSMNDREKKALRESATVIKRAVRELGY